MLYRIIICLILFLGSVSSIANTIYYVKDYGILPNGEEISQKLATLTRKVSNEGGGTIIFEAGEYVMGAGLTKDGVPFGNVRLYPNIHFKGVEGTVLKANNTGGGFHDMFCTLDHSVENVIFEGITFNTYIGTRNRDYNDYRLAIILHWSKNVIVRECRFIHDVGTIDTRYSHLQADKNAGNYRVDGLIIENCSFEARILSESGYRDITPFGICAQNVIIRNNTFTVIEKVNRFQNKYYPNCCLEIQGKDIWIYGNEFRDYTNAIDFTNMDSYEGNRNINIYNNRILCYRGIALWCHDNWYAKGINIYNNYFNLACDNTDKRVCGVKACIVFVSHPTDSNNGYYSDIYISNNVFDYSDHQLYYKSLSYKKWIGIPQHNTDLRNGMSYEEYYSAISLGGSSAVRNNVIIKNNEFKNCLFPCIYVGGKNTSENHIISNNVFYNCSEDTTWSIISLNNQCIDFQIIGNKIIRKDDSKPTISFLKTKWSGLLAEGFCSEKDVVFNGIIVLGNNIYNEKGVKMNYSHCFDSSLLKSGHNNIY